MVTSIQEIVDGMSYGANLNKTFRLYTLYIPQTNCVFPIVLKNLFDDDAMEATIIDNKLDNPIGVLNYDLDSTKQNNTFTSLFDFG